MPIPDQQSLEGEIIDERAALSVADLCRIFAVERRQIEELVDEGVISVVRVEASEWRFNGAALRRARIALRLGRDLGVNLAGVALALELLEELEQLRRAQRG